MTTTAVSSSNGYIYCTGDYSVYNAMSALSQAEYLILDCEGQNLGCDDGILSLFCVGTPQAAQVFVFDAVTLNRGMMHVESLLQLLADPDVYKIMWDGRMDYLEILLRYGIPINGVVDLQLAEVVSRGSVRGEDDIDRTERLKSGFFGYAFVRVWPHLFDGMHLVMGMQKCLNMLGLGEQFSKDPVVQAMHSANQTERWMERPLEPRLIAYAAQDIRLLAVLFDTFCTLGWITPTSIHQVAEQSARYASLFQTREASMAYNTRRLWTVLPLDILTPPSGTLFPCSTCLRLLSRRSFEVRPGGAVSYRRPRCRVCQLGALRRGIPDRDIWLPVF